MALLMTVATHCCIMQQMFFTGGPLCFMQAEKEKIKKDKAREFNATKVRRNRVDVWDFLLCVFPSWPRAPITFEGALVFLYLLAALKGCLPNYPYMSMANRTRCPALGFHAVWPPSFTSMTCAKSISAGKQHSYCVAQSACFADPDPETSLRKLPLFLSQNQGEPLRICSRLRASTSLCIWSACAPCAPHKLDGWLYIYGKFTLNKHV